MPTFQILLIEDDPDIAHLLQTDLHEAGYEVRLAGSVMHGLTQARNHPPHLILTDLGLPDGDGREVVRRLRRTSQIPMVVLTARDDLRDKIDLLEAGANDYLVKPFDPRELLARVAVQLRQNYDQTVTAGALEVSEIHRQVWLAGVEVKLSSTEFDVLMALMPSPGRVYPREILIERVWGERHPVTSNVLEVHLSSLRRKFLATAGSDPVRTVRNVGYGVRVTHALQAAPPILP